MTDFETSAEEVPAPLTPRQELAEFIGDQQGRIGDVYTLTQEGLNAKQIAERLNVDTSGFVYQYQAHAGAALDGIVPSAPTMLKLTVSALNGLVKRGRTTLSPGAFDRLKTNQAKVLAARDELDPEVEVRAEIEAEREEQTQVSTLSIPGIYAFSYGWYLERPLDPEGDNTLIKVGKAENVAARIAQHRHGARAHIPEPLVTIRVYATGERNLDHLEKTFHRLLSAAGHNNPRYEKVSGKNEVGKEWFLTNKSFLDEIASALGLRTVYAE